MKLKLPYLFVILVVFVIYTPIIFSQEDKQTDIRKFEEAEYNFDQLKAQYFAQHEDENQSDMPFPLDDQKFDQSRRKYLEQLRVLKLLELLDLNEEQDIEFIQLFRNHRKVIKKNEKEHNLKIIELSEGLKNENISEESIFRLTADINKITDERVGLEKSFLNKSKEILSAEQYGKLVVFQERFERELLEQVRQFRNQERFGPGRGKRGSGNGKQKTFNFGK